MSWAEITRLDPPKAISQGGYTATFAYAFRSNYDVALVMQLKQAIPYYERDWSDALKTWYVAHHREGAILVDALSTLKALALTCDEAMLIKGNVTTCLKTGRRTEQLTLFGG